MEVRRVTHCPSIRQPRRRGSVRALLALTLILAPFPAAVSAPGDPALDQGQVNLILMEGPGVTDTARDLYLEVILNGVHTRRVIHVVQTDRGQLLAWPANLRDIGLTLAGVAPSVYLPLDALTEVHSRYDEPNQRLYLDAEVHRLNLRRQQLQAADHRRWPSQAGRGAVLNYDLYTQHGDHRNTFNAATGLRAFSGEQVIESTGLTRWSNSGEDAAYVRLDTRWTRSSPDQLWTLTAGDLISGSLPWSRATRLGGVQIRRNFALQPTLLTYPLPQFLGEAALPSDIELYVNGLRQYRGSVQPGPFAIDVPPGVSGSGLGEVVLTDVLGRSRRYEFDFYNSTRLLRAGLSDYAVEIGAVRRQFGRDSFRYRGDIATSGSVRYGFNDALTLEAHAEAGNGVALLGAGLVTGLAGAGTLSSAYAASAGAPDRAGAQGGQVSVDYSWTRDRISIGYGLTRTHGDYRDLAALDGRPPPNRAERALLGLSLGAAGSASLQYTRLDTEDGNRDRRLGAGYSIALFRNTSAYVSGSLNLDDSGDRGIFAGLSMTVGRRISAGIDASRSGDTERYGAYAARSPGSDGGVGWRLRADRGNPTDVVQAEARYLGTYGDVTAGLWSLDARRSVYASASGALVMMRGDLLAARRIDDSFALVSTGGVAGITVLTENRPIGRTNGRGHYVLTGLNAYQPNRVGIDPLDVPVDHALAAVDQDVVPAQRAGVLVNFQLEPVRAALLLLQDGGGRPLPLGTRVLRDSDPIGVPVGFDGQAYLQRLSADNAIHVRLPDGGHCDLRFSLPAGEVLPVIGPLRCEAAP